MKCYQAWSIDSAATGDSTRYTLTVCITPDNCKLIIYTYTVRDPWLRASITAHLRHVYIGSLGYIATRRHNNDDWWEALRGHGGSKILRFMACFFNWLIWFVAYVFLAFGSQRNAVIILTLISSVLQNQVAPPGEWQPFKHHWRDFVRNYIRTNRYRNDGTEARWLKQNVNENKWTSTTFAPRFIDVHQVALPLQIPVQYAYTRPIYSSLFTLTVVQYNIKIVFGHRPNFASASRHSPV